MKFRSVIALLGLLLTAFAPAAQANPATGVYRLTTRGNPGLCLDVVGYGTADGTNVQLWYANHTSNQQWLVEDQGDGTYKIYAYSGQNSLQMLDDSGGNTANGNPVTTYEDNSNPAQLWYFQPVGGGFYRIIPKSAGPTSAQTLDMRNGNGATAGSTANIYTYYGGDNQVFRLDWAGPSQILPSPKKGLGGRDTQTAELHCAWYYDWGGAKPADTPTGVEFVPMFWGYYGGDSTGYLRSLASQPGVTTILGFNEPDHTDQANLSVSTALGAWPYMSNLGIPVGSPAAADDGDSWMQQFMQGVAQQGLRVDYVAIHCYATDPQAFLNYVAYIHNLYGKPVWVTEFAPADWGGNNPVSTDAAASFMRAVVPVLNRLDYVQRYAWYTGASPGPWVLGSAALVNDDGSLTALGRLYSRM